MIAAEIGVTVMYFITSMIVNAFKSQRAVQTKDAGLELVSGIRDVLKYPNVCTASFAGGNPTAGFTKTQIVDSAANVKF